MSIRRLSALLLLGAMVLLLWLSIAQGPGTYQYLILSPEIEAEQSATQDEATKADTPDTAPKSSAMAQLLKTLSTSMEGQASALNSWSVTSYNSSVSVGAAGDSSVTAALQGLWGDASLQGQHVLSSGRQLYPEELESGSAVAVIDERLAMDLFRVGDPVDRKLIIDGQDYLVVGVTRHARSAGETEAALIRVPLKALDKQGFQTTMLCVNMLPRQGAGAYAALSKEMEQWQPGGSFHSLPKERYRAALPLRLLLCGVGLLAVSLTLKMAKAFAIGSYRTVRRRMETRYAARMLPELVGRGFLVTAVYAAILAVIAFTFQQLIAPVYVFPEWVPAILVEPKEIARTFWALRTQETALVSLGTPEILKLRYLHRLMTLACALIALLLMKPYHRLRDKLSMQGNGK